MNCISILKLYVTLSCFSKADSLRNTALFFTVFVFFFCEDFFKEFDEDDGRVEVEEDRQRKRHPLDDDPRHEAVEVGLDQVCSHLLKIKPKSHSMWQH